MQDLWECFWQLPRATGDKYNSLSIRDSTPREVRKIDKTNNFCECSSLFQNSNLLLHFPILTAPETLALFLFYVVTYCYFSMGKRKIRCKYWGKKRVFHGNQLTKLIVEQEEEARESDEGGIFDDVEEFLDSSSAKIWGMPFFGNEENSEDEYDSGDEEYEQSVNENRIVYLPALQALFDGCCVCSHCKNGGLVLSEGENHSMAPCLLLNCDQCSFVCSEILRKKVVHGKSEISLM